MHLSLVEIENYRIFGEGSDKLNLQLQSGLNLIVGENNSGKSAIMDALRLLLGTRDQEFLRVTPQDFHVRNGQPATRFSIRCTFDDLDDDEAAMFLEWLELVRQADGSTTPRLTVHLEARRRDERERRSRFDRLLDITVTAGPDADGRAFDGATRECLRATYLKPLRDAEQELQAKRGSRLSQILGVHPDLAAQKDDQDEGTLISIMVKANTAVRDHAVLIDRMNELNGTYLTQLTLGDDALRARISVAPMNLRAILERLALSIAEEALEDVRHGLGLDNLLFIATEFLLLQGPQAPLRLALIEEPEAHLHPQLQLRLMAFLEAQLSHAERPVQVILSSHSPHLASSVDLESVVFMRKGRAFPMASTFTGLAPADYGHLRYFLDVTKANLFFARGVMIVEGPAEQLLLPALADVLGRSLSKFGVSIVSVGSTGLFRYARVFHRRDGQSMDVRVACLTDRDLPPPEAKTPGGGLGPLVQANRKTVDELSPAEIAGHVARRREKSEGGPVKVYVSPEWTLEYDLAASGFALHVFVACELARHEHILTEDEREQQLNEAVQKYVVMRRKHPGLTNSQLACHVYSPLAAKSVSKTETAYYLAWLFRRTRHKHVGQSGETRREHLAKRLPSYLVEALAYVTRQAPLPELELTAVEA